MANDDRERAAQPSWSESGQCQEVGIHRFQEFGADKPWGKLGFEE